MDKPEVPKESAPTSPPATPPLHGPVRSLALSLGWLGMTVSFPSETIL